MGAGCHTLRERAPSYALDERTHQPTPVIEKEMTTHTHKSIKGSMGASTIWERTHQTTIEDDMDTVLFVCFICLFVCLVFV